MKINVLGTEYEVVTGKNADDILPDESDGVCDETIKRMAVTEYTDARGRKDSKGELDVQVKKVKRHEIIHAFLFESGLAENSQWAQNEEMVDWFAIQGPKLIEAWKAAGAL